jgi:hypothetical protein
LARGRRERKLAAEFFAMVALKLSRLAVAATSQSTACACPTIALLRRQERVPRRPIPVNNTAAHTDGSREYKRLPHFGALVAGCAGHDSRQLPPPYLVVVASVLG